MIIVRILKVKISIKRITDFLSEPEVDRNASSLKREDINPTNQGVNDNAMESDKLGIQNGVFLWSPPNNVTLAKDTSDKKSWWKPRLWSKSATSDSNAVSEASTALVGLPIDSVENPEQIVATSALASGISGTPVSSGTDRQFQLRDINVLFPIGGLSLITGPTASGKTALLRALLGEMYTIPRISETDPETRIFLPKNPTILEESTGMRRYVSYASQVCLHP